jgi:hypothetical protein
VGGVGEQVLLVATDVLHPDPLEIVQGGSEPDGVRDAAGTGLEPDRRRLVLRLFERDVANHVAAALPRRHGVQQVGLPVQDPDAGRSEHLVSRKCVPVAVKILNVDAHVRHRLSPVDEHPRAVAMRHRHHLARRGHRPEGIRDVRERDQPRARPQQLLVLVEHHLPALIHGHHTQNRTRLLAKLLPRNDGRVMLEPCDHISSPARTFWRPQA